jgi:hypothetical protein
MNKTRKEIECIARLQHLGGNVDDILEFLLGENLILREDARVLRLNPEVSKSMQSMLQGLSTSGKLQLLEYEWTILPVERIKIHLITDRASKEFVYNF